MSKNKVPAEKKYILYDKPEDCAREAAKIFAQQRWRWTIYLDHLNHKSKSAIPTEQQILEELHYLKKCCWPGINGIEEISTGRLTYASGKYGHERPNEDTINKDSNGD